MKNIFKTFAIAGLALGLVSCNNRFEGDEIKSIDRVAIDSVKMVSDTMMVYDIQSIRTYSKYQEGCEGFYGYQYDKEQMDRNVTAYKFKTDAQCGNLGTRGTKFEFRPEKTGTYTFNFWQGKDNSGNDLWLSKKIVVTN